MNEPEPDLAVTREDTTVYADRHPGPADLHLVVEVSDTTLRTDLDFKAGLYARAGIPEYWALDLASRRIPPQFCHHHRRTFDIRRFLTPQGHMAPNSATNSRSPFESNAPPTVSET